MSEPILQVKDLKKHYVLKRFLRDEQIVRAVDGVSLSLKSNETVAVVGESGCGKSTLAKSIMRLEEKTAGEIFFHGKTVEEMDRGEFIRQVQMIFQDPYGSLNPRKKVLDIIAEPLVVNEKLSSVEIKERVADLMQKVGLRADQQSRYPHMFSGGQRQRIGIARALILQPKVIICDEPVSALDISIQAQVLNLLMELQDEESLSYLFISHDLSVVKHISHRVVVMYFGKIVEVGGREEIFYQPLHPYTRALLASTPGFLHEKKNIIKGEMPSPLNPPAGCAFHSRCPLATDLCRQKAPVLEEKQGRPVACHHV